MGSDKANEDSPYRKFYHNYKPISVATDVEDIMLVADIICHRKILMYLRQIMPLSLSDNVIPPLQRHS